MPKKDTELKAEVKFNLQMKKWVIKDVNDTRWQIAVFFLTGN